MVEFQLYTDDQWREILSAEEYHVLREAGTEAPFTGEYVDTTTVGVYHCRACGAELFRSEHKFNSHCGWPSFFSPLAEDRILTRDDYSLGHHRTEVLCARCGSHLGHVFAGEGYDTPTDLRYCINSICLTLEESTPGGYACDGGRGGSDAVSPTGPRAAASAGDAFRGVG